MAADWIRRAGTGAPAEAEVARVSAPLTGDTWRHLATSDDTDNGADWHVAMVYDTPRHAGLALQNRRLQVRFLSHLPLNLEFMGIASPVVPADRCTLTPLLCPI